MGSRPHIPRGPKVQQTRRREPASLALPAAAACPPLLDHRMNTLQGQPANLCQYEGKVLVVVNTASYCGYTDQYKGLEALYQKYKGQGLVVLGVPSNDFGGQEPGTAEQVADFCERTYKVRFPMLEKSVVSGEGRDPALQGALREDRAGAEVELPQVRRGPPGRAAGRVPERRDARRTRSSWRPWRRPSSPARRSRREQSLQGERKRRSIALI